MTKFTTCVFINATQRVSPVVPDQSFSPQVPLNVSRNLFGVTYHTVYCRDSNDLLFTEIF